MSNLDPLVRPRGAARVLFAIFCALCAATLIRGGEVGYTHLFVFAMTGFLLAEVLRSR